MPELPEVETTLRGLIPYTVGHTIVAASVHTPRLRQPIPTNLPQSLTHSQITQATRRAKYLLFHLSTAHTLLLHLGMSGRLSITPAAAPRLKHDHLTLTTTAGHIRFNDARRFGLALLIPTAQLSTHPLIAPLGPEPLTAPFSSTYLHAATRRTSVPIKQAIMANHLVVGVGNIYASESLHRAGIHPATPAKQLTKRQSTQLHSAIVHTLQAAIAAGGSTLRDYTQPNGHLGYFAHQFAVYGRTGQPCLTCTTPIQSVTLGQRSTFFCPTCQR
jgi:formamidopyrimidine-DNA glycosylase